MRLILNLFYHQAPLDLFRPEYYFVKSIFYDKWSQSEIEIVPFSYAAKVLFWFGFRKIGLGINNVNIEM